MSEERPPEVPRRGCGFTWVDGLKVVAAVLLVLAGVGYGIAGTCGVILSPMVGGNAGRQQADATLRESLRLLAVGSGCGLLAIGMLVWL
jgi:hypothetical protein